MPRANEMEQFNTPSNYQFSGERVEDLGASEYTVCTLVTDISGSVFSFKKEIEECQKKIIESCQLSPRSDNLLFRSLGFNQNLTELFGFRNLNSISLNEFDNYLYPSGSTALYDSAYESIESSVEYAKNLYNAGIAVNAIVFVITDGLDNASKETPERIKNLLKSIIKKEELESIRIILIGITGGDKLTEDGLKLFKDEANLDQYVNIDQADKKTLAKLAEFISKSISSQSAALGTGGPSKSLTF